LVVDGYNNFQTEGFSSVGVSNVYTDSGEPLFYSENGGVTWDSLAASPLAVYVEGDTCSTNLQIMPAQPVVCPGESVELSVPEGFLSYTWSNGSTAANAIVDQFGIYTIEVIDADFCVSTANVVVVTGAVPTLALLEEYTYCEGDSVTLAVNPFYNSYLWSTGETVSSIQASEPGMYTIDVTSAAGCGNSDTTMLVEFPAPTVDLGGDRSLCQGEFLSLTAGPDFQSYNWSNGESDLSIDILSTTTAWVFVQDSNNCWGSSDTVTITVNPLPNVPTVTQDFEGLQSTFAFAYQWLLDGDTLAGATDQTLMDPAPGVYQVVVESAFGCRAMSDSIVVNAEEVGNFISEGFSPNGDGLNEAFFVEGIERFAGNSLTVFNRWGETVFEAQGYANDWTGTGPGGVALPDGNYFYVLDLGNGDPPIKGIVLINR
ncbi:MAG: gliding motility-associated C-terminal domain-containing protein, partial [Bacteroidota bacterium]